MLILEKRYKILKYIRNNPGTINFKMSKVIDMTVSSMSLILRDYEKRGLIERKPIGRIKRVFITKKGLEILKKLDRINELWK